MEVGPQFERGTGHKLTIATDVAAAAKRRIEGGEPFDVAILVPAMIGDLAKQGKLVADTRTDVARDAIALTVKAGAAKPDIASLDGFKRALLEMKSIAIVEGGAAGPPHWNKVFDRLGIAEAMKPKIRLQPNADRMLQAVADGEVEAGLLITSLIVRAKGVDLVGRLPKEAQFPFAITAAVGSSAKEPEGAKAFIKFLASEPAAAVIKAKGLEPVAR